MANKKTTITPFLLVVLIFALSLFLTDWTNTTASANVRDDITAKQKQIEELERQIEEYQTQIDTTRSKSKTLKNEIVGLNAKINQLSLEIKSMSLAINQTSLEINDAENKIDRLQSEIGIHKNAMAQYIKIVYENDQKNLTEVILKNQSLSGFFKDIDSVNATQNKLQAAIGEMKQLKSDLGAQKDDLEDKKTDLERLKNLQEIAKKNIDRDKSQKNTILKETKGQESKFQELVKKSQKDIEALKNQIGYLIQNGVSVEEAVKSGQLAAIAADIRPAFLLAELEQESALGKNVGKCYITDTTSGNSRKITTGQVFKRGIHPTRDLALFLTITKELGKDPFQTAISCWPGSGWGGAMGPAQFIPSTWVSYAAQVAGLVGRSIANPWNIEDAFTAAAVKLARGGATSKTRAGEVAASKAYYCGNPKSTRSGCVNYANSVQRKAAEIEKNL
ncbi:MAG: hypothetical protein A2606_01880 [Candidatus Yanofskybacteria bacterium RIFOXYD1_FULL_42_10]|uniref:Transglycosylase SLT domain-containing protein n=2 Tax=Candidatus Yanofskyibacteriota TaxID=1752733 RepID=A0A1F8HTD8_9BACT|nr:MAG: hypothetical protein A2606_01880 [Candidatus Yanofskybacteria bacterium RIFOXYD1_FULL_42_10]